jgi:hypothetical protein
MQRLNPYSLYNNSSRTALNAVAVTNRAQVGRKVDKKKIKANFVIQEE